MSRIGKQPVEIPQGVKIKISRERLTVEGPKGKLSQDYLPMVSFKAKESVVEVLRNNETKQARALHGLYRQILNNMVIGVSKGFEKVLQINGVGYRAELQGKELLLNLGFSNQIIYMIPQGVEIQVENQNRIIIKSIDKVLLGQTAADIRSIRPPEPYKGKGIRYENEYVRRKEGKAGIK